MDKTTTTEGMSMQSVGPCNCCGEITDYVPERRDEDSWYYCSKCWRIGEEEDRKDPFYAFLFKD